MGSGVIRAIEKYSSFRDGWFPQYLCVGCTFLHLARLKSTSNRPWVLRFFLVWKQLTTHYRTSRHKYNSKITWRVQTDSCFPYWKDNLWHFTASNQTETLFPINSLTAKDNLPILINETWLLHKATREQRSNGHALPNFYVNCVVVFQNWFHWLCPDSQEFWFYNVYVGLCESGWTKADWSKKAFKKTVKRKKR